MTERLSERERLIEHLDTHCIDQYGELQTWKVANFILADRARIVEPLLKALKKADNEDCAFGQCDIYEEAIDETLKRANGGE